jgi:AcrR family transcriptional regulator
MSREYRKRKRAESEAQTRQRITEAVMRLHETIGPAKTTVSAIADEAGVQRATVYRHFPDEEALVDACSTHWLSLNPPPDPSPWSAIADPDERLRRALRETYDWYAGTEDMVEKIVRDAPRVPAIAVRMRARLDAADAIAELLMAGRRLRGARRKRVRAAIGHGLEFETWRSLVRRQGLSTDEAVDAVASLAGAAG